MVNEGTWETPDARYHLAYGKEGTIQVFDSYAAFSSAVAKLPEGTVLHRYDKCTVSLAKRTDFDVDEFAKRCKSLGLTVAADAQITCNCGP